MRRITPPKNDNEMTRSKRINRIFIIVLLIILLCSPLLIVWDANISAAYDHRKTIKIGELSESEALSVENLNEIVSKAGG